VEKRREQLERELKYIMTGEEQIETVKEKHFEIITQTNKKRS
jgi:hypothetical protein